VTHFEMIWKRIEEHAGELFRTKSGVSFEYTVAGTDVLPKGDDRVPCSLDRTQFQKAHALGLLRGPAQINRLVGGPSYVYAILTDPRIA
jgi:hypothetical protein